MLKFGILKRAGYIGAGSNLKVERHEFWHFAPEKFFFCAPFPHFSAVLPPI